MLLSEAAFRLVSEQEVTTHAMQRPVWIATGEGKAKFAGVIECLKAESLRQASHMSSFIPRTLSWHLAHVEHIPSCMQLRSRSFIVAKVIDK